MEDAASTPDVAPLLPFFGRRVRVTLSDGRQIVGVLQVRGVTQQCFAVRCAGIAAACLVALTSCVAPPTSTVCRRTEEHFCN